MHEYHYQLESDYGVCFGMIEANNEKEFYEILKQEHKADINADGCFDCPVTADEKPLNW